MTNFDAKAWIIKQDPAHFILDDTLNVDVRRKLLEALIVFTYLEGRSSLLVEDAQEDRK